MQRRLDFNVGPLCGPFLAFAILAGCSITGGSPPKQSFDLGMPTHPTASSAASSRIAIVVEPLTASDWLDSNAMVYRLAYVDAQQPKRYANSQWTGVPAELLTRRLRAHFAEVANVVDDGDAVGAPQLKVELEEFDQVFDSPQQSRSVLKVRATLVKTGRLIGQRTFFVEEGAPTPDAAGGAHALAELSQNVVEQVVQWTMTTLK